VTLIVDTGVFRVLSVLEPSIRYRFYRFFTNLMHWQRNTLIRQSCV